MYVKKFEKAKFIEFHNGYEWKWKFELNSGKHIIVEQGVLKFILGRVPIKNEELLLEFKVNHIENPNELIKIKSIYLVHEYKIKILTEMISDILNPIGINPWDVYNILKKVERKMYASNSESSTSYNYFVKQLEKFAQNIESENRDIKTGIDKLIPLKNKIESIKKYEKMILFYLDNSIKPLYINQLLFSLNYQKIEFDLSDNLINYITNFFYDQHNYDLKNEFTYINDLLISLGVLVNDKLRMAYEMRYLCTLKAFDTGNTYLEKDEFNSLFEYKLLFENRNEITQTLFNKKWIIEENNVIFEKLIYIQEKSVSEKLVHFLMENNELTNNLDEFLFNKTIEEIKLSDEQKEALKLFSNNKILLINGGAGTGKTTVIKAMIELFLKAYPMSSKKIFVAAPTGMAANNIKEKMNDDIFRNTKIGTIHSILEAIDFHTFMRNENNKIEADLLIVDESSMINLFAFYSLFKAIPNTIKRIVFIGDSNQLPPIEVGNVFEQMVNFDFIPKVTLKQNHRQLNGKGIIELSQKILSNDLNRTNVYEFIDSLKKYSDIEMMFDIKPDELYEMMYEKYSVPKEEYIQQKFQIITPVTSSEKEYSYNDSKLNTKISNKINTDKKFHKNIKLNDKIMILKNDNNIEIYNGQLGWINPKENKIDDVIFYNMKMKNKDLPIFDNSNQIYTFASSSTVQMKLAYAITVHKSQGGEFDELMYCVEGKTSNERLFHNKRMAYTAVTRAKNNLILCGKKEVFVEQILTNFKNIKSMMIYFINNCLTVKEGE
ncbi:ATP-dependent DNA helicase [Spiroplasma culicicola]|uniref:Exodeoxyribonuclease V subunit alpha n=1 Tax=Spiroplasma culicicola AES-1 TaxID=1276246 RepID=W6A6Q1_9MOLU|nr:AAA family ATPase [Spiroplasma culicicola]AHI52773.1 exodeoxyribonuclease V subunit alpha [Spiroplasma culicicola AES-1]